MLAVDYGEARIGLALHDDRLLAAAPRGLGTLARRGRDWSLQQLVAMARRHEVTQVVVGIPLAADGGVGKRAVQARNFARDLEKKLSLPVYLQDERDSTAEAMQRLVQAGVPRGKRGGKLDEIAAVIILERFLESIKQGGAQRFS